MTRARSLLLDFLLLGISVVLFACFLEGLLRIVFARSLDFSMEMWKYAVALKQPVADPRLSFVHRPGRSAFLMGVDFTIDSAGLRDREFSREKPPGVRRIVWLGDSTTVGWGVPLDATAPKLLEHRLNSGTGLPACPGTCSTRARYEVLNAGVGNYDTVQEVEHYLTIDRAFHPDQVILEYFINDAEPVPRERNTGIAGHSYLAAFAIARFDGLLRLTGLRPDWRAYYASLYRDGSPGLQAAKAALARLANATAADGATLLVAVLPELHQINATYPFAAEQKKIEDRLASLRVRTLDLLPCLRGHGPEESLWITPADDHPNAKANGLIAACVADALR